MGIADGLTPILCKHRDDVGRSEHIGNANRQRGDRGSPVMKRCVDGSAQNGGILTGNPRETPQSLRTEITGASSDSNYEHTKFQIVAPKQQ